MRVKASHLALLLAFSALGLASSSLVLYEYYKLHRPPPLCTIPQAQPRVGDVAINCQLVLSSPYSKVGPVSLDELAAIWFVINIALVLLTVFAPATLARATFRALFGWRFIGVAVVPYLVYIELFVIHAICIYCTTMHAAIVADFTVITLLMFRRSSELRRALFTGRS